MVRGGQPPEPIDRRLAPAGRRGRRVGCVSDGAGGQPGAGQQVQAGDGHGRSAAAGPGALPAAEARLQRPAVGLDPGAQRVRAAQGRDLPASDGRARSAADGRRPGRTRPHRPGQPGAPLPPHQGGRDRSRAAGLADQRGAAVAAPAHGHEHRRLPHGPARRPDQLLPPGRPARGRACPPAAAGRAGPGPADGAGGGAGRQPAPHRPGAPAAGGAGQAARGRTAAAGRAEQPGADPAAAAGAAGRADGGRRCPHDGHPRPGAGQHLLRHARASAQPARRMARGPGTPDAPARAAPGARCADLARHRRAAGRRHLAAGDRRSGGLVSDLPGAGRAADRGAHHRRPPAAAGGRRAQHLAARCRQPEGAAQADRRRQRAARLGAGRPDHRLDRRPPRAPAGARRRPAGRPVLPGRQRRRGRRRRQRSAGHAAGTAGGGLPQQRPAALGPGPAGRAGAAGAATGRRALGHAECAGLLGRRCAAGVEAGHRQQRPQRAPPVDGQPRWLGGR